MIRIDKLREAADLLLGKYRYSEAFSIYDELYQQIWCNLGMVQWNYAGYSGNISRTSVPSYSAFRDKYIDTAANTICTQTYKKSLDQTLNEFAYVIYGHLKCICYSNQNDKVNTTDNVLNEFLILYTLVMQPIHNRKISLLFSKISLVLDGDRRLKSVRSNLSRYSVEKYLLENAEKNSNGEWRAINGLLLEYLSRAGSKKSELYVGMSDIVGKQYYRSRYKNQNSYWEKGESRYENKYEGYSNQYSKEQKEFCPATATEKEKMAYYGKLIDLKGKMTKTQIRSNYINLVSLYHPDKVQHLGPELKELAERKSKEINAAYSWLKTKYHI